MALTKESALRKDRTNGASATLEHRHFAFIAATLKDLALGPGLPESQAQWMYTVQAFADACASSNPRFDRARFLRACGVQS